MTPHASRNHALGPFAEGLVAILDLGCQVHGFLPLLAGAGLSGTAEIRPIM
jgi:hypothetical protein